MTDADDKQREDRLELKARMLHDFWLCSEFRGNNGNPIRDWKASLRKRLRLRGETTTVKREERERMSLPSDRLEERTLAGLWGLENFCEIELRRRRMWTELLWAYVMDLYQEEDPIKEKVLNRLEFLLEWELERLETVAKTKEWKLEPLKKALAEVAEAKAKAQSGPIEPPPKEKDDK